MRTLKKILIWILGIALVLLLAIGSTAIWVFNNPEKAVQIAQKHILPEDLSISWKTLEIDPKYLGGLNFSLVVDAEDLLIQRENLEAPIDRIHLSSSFYFTKTDKHRLDELVILAPREIVIKQVSANTKKEQDEQNLYQQAANILGYLGALKENFMVTKVDMDISKVTIQSAASSTSASFKAFKENSESIDLDIKVATGTNLDASLKGSVNLGQQHTEPLFKGSLSVASKILTTD